MMLSVMLTGCESIETGFFGSSDLDSGSKKDDEAPYYVSVHVGVTVQALRENLVWSEDVSNWVVASSEPLSGRVVKISVANSVGNKLGMDKNLDNIGSTSYSTLIDIEEYGCITIRAELLHQTMNRGFLNTAGIDTITWDQIDEVADLGDSCSFNSVLILKEQYRDPSTYPGT